MRDILVFTDPSGALHAVDPYSKAYLWTSQTKTPAFRLYKNASLKLAAFFGFDSTGSAREVHGVIDEKYLMHFDNRTRSTHKMPISIEVDTCESLQERVDKLSTPQEYQVKGNTGEFWINTHSGQIYMSLPDDQMDLVRVLRKDFRLHNERKKIDLEFSIFEEGSKIKVVHVRSFNRLISILNTYGIEEESIPFEKLRVDYDSRVTRGDGKIMYRGHLRDPCDREFQPGFVMVQEADTKDVDRIIRFYSHLGSHPNLVNFLGVQEFERKKYLVFEMFKTEDTGDLDNTLKSILLGALHIFKKNRIHGNLEPFNVVWGYDGGVKLFGAMGYVWTTLNEKQELLKLGTLLANCICKNNDMITYERENPVACDVVKKLQMNRITLPSLTRHHYLWEPEAVMKFFYDVTVCIDDRKHGGCGELLEVELQKQVNEDRVYKNKKGNLHRKYLEHMELRSKLWTYQMRSLSGLLKLARNTYGHEPQLNDGIRGLWGRCTKGLGNYLCGKNGIFPCLPIVVFDLVELCCPKGGILKQYTG